MTLTREIAAPGCAESHFSQSGETWVAWVNNTSADVVPLLPKARRSGAPAMEDLERQAVNTSLDFDFEVVFAAGGNVDSVRAA